MQHCLIKVIAAVTLLLFISAGLGNLRALASPATQKEPSDSATAKETDGAAVSTAASKAAGSSQSAAVATTNPPASEDPARKKKWAHASVSFTVAAPQEVVWNVLVDFEHYPNIFKRIETCKVTKRENDVVYTESYLRPQLFVRQRCNHTWINVSQKPNALSWKLLDGNFKGAEGNWDCKTVDKTKTEVKYTLAADPGPIIPAALVSWILHSVVKEVVDSVQTTCSESYKAKINSTPSK
jgi:ribosome-associated toxin RatA of RatAB toxin-antitoxin module